MNIGTDSPNYCHVLEKVRRVTAVTRVCDLNPNYLALPKSYPLKNSNISQYHPQRFHNCTEGISWENVGRLHHDFRYCNLDLKDDVILEPA
jgi:hypothetical protein